MSITLLENAIVQSIEIKEQVTNLEYLLKKLTFWTENPEIAGLVIYTEEDRLKTYISFYNGGDKQEFASRSGIDPQLLLFGDDLEIFLWGKSKIPYLPEGSYRRPPNVEEKTASAIAALNALK